MYPAHSWTWPTFWGSSTERLKMILNLRYLQRGTWTRQKKAKANEYCTRKTFYIKESNLFGRQVTFSNFSFINETDSGEEQRKGVRVSKLRRYFPNGQGWGISLLSLSVSSEARDPILFPKEAEKQRQTERCISSVQVRNLETKWKKKTFKLTNN